MVGAGIFFGISEAEQETLRLIDLETPPDSIFALSDLTMTGAIRGIYKKNLLFPKDIAVIGFCEEISRTMYNPSLSAIQPMGLEIGRKSAEILFEHIVKEPYARMEPQVIYLEGKLVIGGST